MALDNPEFTFQKLTIANSSEVGGSDLTRYKLFKEGKLIGEINYDHYFRKMMIAFGDKRYRISYGFFSGIALYNDKTNKKIAKVILSNPVFSKGSKATLKFIDGLKFSMTVNDFKEHKSYQTRLSSAQSDVLFDFLIQHPRSFSFLREVPLEGEITTVEIAENPLLVLYGLALLELLIVFCDQTRGRH